MSRQPKKLDYLPRILYFPDPVSKFEFSPVGKGKDPPFYKTKVIPEGASDCLAKISFVVSGIMPSLKREDIKSLIEKHGGNFQETISEKTDVLIRGCLDVDQKDIDFAKSKNIKIIDEDSLFSVISTSTSISYLPIMELQEILYSDPINIDQLKN